MFRWKIQICIGLLTAAAVSLTMSGFHPGLVRAATPPPFKFYLPLVMGPAGPLNGDFEKGRVVWSETSTHAWKLILTAGELPVAPHGGYWAAWLGGALNETDALQQTTRVGEMTPYLSYWRWIAADEPNCAANLAQVLVNNFAADRFGLCVANNTHGWVKRVLDLRAYSGQTVTLKFTASIASANNANLYLDDVAFQSSP